MDLFPSFLSIHPALFVASRYSNLKCRNLAVIQEQGNNNNIICVVSVAVFADPHRLYRSLIHVWGIRASDMLCLGHFLPSVAAHVHFLTGCRSLRERQGVYRKDSGIKKRALSRDSVLPPRSCCTARPSIARLTAGQCTFPRPCSPPPSQGAS